MKIKRKYVMVPRVEDWNLLVKAKVLSESDTEISVEYRLDGMTWGQTIPKNSKQYAELR